MILSTAVIFFLTLILILALFTLKQWEVAHGRTFLPAWRRRADEKALHLKDLALAARTDVEHLPPFLLDAARSIVHGIAVDAGHIAIWLGRQSHRLADTVSQRNFEAREPRSEFLKKVSEHKNGNSEEETTSL